MQPGNPETPTFELPHQKERILSFFIFFQPFKLEDNWVWILIVVLLLLAVLVLAGVGIYCFLKSR